MLVESGTIEKITSFIRDLSAKEQRELLKAFEYRKSLQEAARLSRSVKKNSVSLSTITDVVNKVRHERKRSA